MQFDLRGRVDDFLGTVDQEVAKRPFIVGNRPTIADLSMCGYLLFPPEESGYNLAAHYPTANAWLRRITALRGWQAAYGLLPGPRPQRYV